METMTKTEKQETALAPQDLALTNEQKVAVLLASLPERSAAVILQRLSPPVLSRVANAIRQLGVVSGEVRHGVMAECLQGIVAARHAVMGNEQTASNLLMQAIGEKRAQALLHDKEGKQTAFAALEGMSAEQILSVIGREQPSAIAMVLRYLDPELAADVLNLVPREVSKRVMMILCTGRPPSEAVVSRVQDYIESRLGKSKETESADIGDMIDRASTILQSVDHVLSEDILQAIDEQRPELGTELRDRLFKFDDIVRLNDVDMRRIMQEVEMDALAIALRTAPVDVREKFFNNMSRRAAEGIKEDMEYSPKIKLSEVEIKQKEIISIIRELDAQGEISLQEGGRNEYV
jgi:flagellar motor switch protein FliG